MPEFGAAKAGDRREGITETQSEVTGLQGAFEQQVGQTGVTLKEALESKRKLDKIDNDTWLLDTVNAYRKEARDTYGQEFTKGGRDTVGAVDRTREGFDKFQADIRANAPNKQYANLATSQISSIFNPLQDKLSDHGLKQLETGMINSLNNEVDAIAEEVFVSGGTPEALQAGIDQTRLQFDLYRENYGNDKADILEQQAVENVAIEALKRQIGADPAGTAEAITRGDYNEFIDTETRDDLLQMANGQSKINETRAKGEEVARVEEVNQSAFDAFAEGTLTLGQIQSADIPTKDKNAWATKLNGQAKNPGRFDKSDPATYAEMSGLVYLSPDRVTRDDLFKLVGATGDKWISTNDFETLSRVLAKNGTGSDDSNLTKSVAAVVKIMDRDRKEGVFGEGQEGDIEHARQVRDLNEYFKDSKNKDQDPITYYSEVMRPSKASFWDRTLDWIPFVNPKATTAAGQAEVLRERRQEFRGERTGQPTLNDFITRARENEANEGFTDEQLERFYVNKYGG